MTTLLEGGVELPEALRALQQDAHSPAMARTLRTLDAQIRQGNPLSAAVADSPLPQRRIIASMIAAGERSGSLKQAFRHVAAFLEDRLTLRRRLVSALAYPTLVVLLAMVIMGVLLLRVVPSVTEVYQEARTALPLSTRVVIAVSGHLSARWPWDLGVLLAGALLLRRAAGSERGRLLRDQALLRIPLLRQITALILVRRLFVTLADLLAAGVPPVDALGLGARATGNRLVELRVRDAAARIRSGQGMVDALGAAGCLPPTVESLLRAADEAGRLDQGFTRAAALIRELTSARLELFFALFEPALVLVVSLLVGFLAFAVLLPIFEMGSLL
jgi:type II secretory pathway component PulF